MYRENYIIYSTAIDYDYCILWLRLKQSDVRIVRDYISTSALEKDLCNILLKNNILDNVCYDDIIEFVEANCDQILEISSVCEIEFDCIVDYGNSNQQNVQFQNIIQSIGCDEFIKQICALYEKYIRNLSKYQTNH